VSPTERRQLERFRLRVPLRFRMLGLAADHSEHFAETANVSRGGFFFVTSAPLQVGMPIEATLNMPAEITGGKADVTRCRARLVHAKPDAYSDGPASMRNRKLAGVLYLTSMVVFAEPTFSKRS